MAISIGDFKYATAYGNNAGAVSPISPGEDLSTAYTDALSGDSTANFKNSLQFASAGVDALGKRKQAKEMAQAYLDQAKAVNKAADERIAAEQAAARKRNGSGFGSLFGSIVGSFFGPVGTAVGGALGGAVGGLV